MSNHTCKIGRKTRAARRIAGMLMSGALAGSLAAGGAGAITVTAATWQENADYIFNYLTQELGYTEAAACGIMANIRCESTFNPHAWNAGGGSYGLCQWTGGRYGRLQSWCRSNGFDYTTIDGQLAYLEYELNSFYPGVENHLRSVENTSDGAYDAGQYYCYHFEAPASRGSVSVYRGGLASGTFWESYRPAEWYQIDGVWHYILRDGSYQTAWLTLEDGTFYFDQDGNRISGWRTIDGERFFFEEDGAMVTGWKKIDGRSYYFDKDGTLITGILHSGDDWFLLDERGNVQASAAMKEFAPVWIAEAEEREKETVVASAASGETDAAGEPAASAGPASPAEDSGVQYPDEKASGEITAEEQAVPGGNNNTATTNNNGTAASFTIASSRTTEGAASAPAIVSRDEAEEEEGPSSVELLRRAAEIAGRDTETAEEDPSAAQAMMAAAMSQAEETDQTEETDQAEETARTADTNQTNLPEEAAEETADEAETDSEESSEETTDETEPETKAADEPEVERPVLDLPISELELAGELPVLTDATGSMEELPAPPVKEQETAEADSEESEEETAEEPETDSEESGEEAAEEADTGSERSSEEATDEAEPETETGAADEPEMERPVLDLPISELELAGELPALTDVTGSMEELPAHPVKDPAATETDSEESVEETTEETETETEDQDEAEDRENADAEAEGPVEEALEEEPESEKSSENGSTEEKASEQNDDPSDETDEEQSKEKNEDGTVASSQDDTADRQDPDLKEQEDWSDNASSGTGEAAAEEESDTKESDTEETAPDEPDSEKSDAGETQENSSAADTGATGGNASLLINDGSAGSTDQEAASSEDGKISLADMEVERLKNEGEGSELAESNRVVISVDKEHLPDLTAEDLEDPEKLVELFREEEILSAVTGSGLDITPEVTASVEESEEKENFYQITFRVEFGGSSTEVHIVVEAAEAE